MIPIEASDLQPGDIIKLTEGGRERTIKKVHYPSYDAGELRVVDFVTFPDVTMPASCDVVGLELLRIVEVLCAVCGGTEKMQVDLASGKGAPRLVVCDACDDGSTREVLRRMKGETT